MTIPKRPIRKRLRGLPAFTTIRGGAVLLPARHQGAAVSRERSSGAPVMRSKTSPRTYNQVEVPRPYTPGRRRFSIYWTWSYPWEANRDVTEMDNRFSTITEVRRVAWPAYETPEYSAQMFLQGISGTLELFHLVDRCVSSSSLAS